MSHSDNVIFCEALKQFIMALPKDIEDDIRKLNMSPVELDIYIIELSKIKQPLYIIKILKDNKEYISNINIITDIILKLNIKRSIDFDNRAFEMYKHITSKEGVKCLNNTDLKYNIEMILLEMY